MADTPPGAPTQSLNGKPRSCVTCRSRKVRCDKLSPCSNCRRADIPCLLPAVADRRPRWARRLERHNAQVKPIPNATLASTPGVVLTAAGTPSSGGTELKSAMERLQNLEELIKDLRSQLEEARTSGKAPGNDGGLVGSAQASTTALATNNVTNGREISQSSPESGNRHQDSLNRLGRLVLEDPKHSHYVSSTFWSRVDEEIDELKRDTLDPMLDQSVESGDESSPMEIALTSSSGQTPSSYNDLLFQHNTGQDLQQFRPLPSQVPFLLDIFDDNINLFMRIVHIPTLSKLSRKWRATGMRSCTPSEEALMFSIYYAAITSMEEEDVMNSFGASKHELSVKYRRGMEQALAGADFLIAPNLTIVQALTIFLLLARRHDSPRYVWMMTGLVIRIAQYLGLQRDGAHFEKLGAFETEMRRRVWWAVCMLDLRSSEDEGTEFTISSASSDTKIPSNINEDDISLETKDMPEERHGVTDGSFVRIVAGMTATMKQMTALSSAVTLDSAARMQDQSRMLLQISESFEREYIQHIEPQDIGNTHFQVVVACARLIMSKMTLIVFLPVLSSSLSAHLSEDIRNKLLISAIEVAELNHLLNAEDAYKQWRWVFQTHTHWHAIVYLLINVSRRVWSPMIERAWSALQSPWLIPPRLATERNSRTWVPLRRLMNKARLYRDAELIRLRNDSEATAEAEKADEQFMSLADVGLRSVACRDFDIYRDRWFRLLHPQENVVSSTNAPGTFESSSEPRQAGISAQYKPQPNQSLGSAGSVVFVGAPNAQWLWDETDSPRNEVQTAGDHGAAPVDTVMNWELDMDWNSWLKSASLQG